VNAAQAWQTILGSGAVIVGLIAQSWIARRFQERKHEETNEKVDRVEETVNGNFTRALDEIASLKALLTAHGIVVPPPPIEEGT
jgi:hypothetical protein